MFNLNHVFVTFAPGSGGNFITALMQRIKEGNLLDLPINQHGSFHILDNGKREGNDSIAFGSNPEENESFSSIEEREAFYINQIKKEYLNPREIVTWSHDYTNLPLYKKHFPKCKTMAITVYTPEEKLMSMIMQVNKVILTSEKDIAISLNLWNILKNRLKEIINTKLKEATQQDEDFSFVFDKRFNPEYSDIVFYYSTVTLLQYAFLNDALSLIEEPKSKVQNNIPYKNIIDKNADGILPFSHLPNNDIEAFVKSYSDTLCRLLSNEEILYLENAFVYYYNMQDKFLMKNPVEYFHQRKLKAMEALNELKLDIAAGIC